MDQAHPQDKSVTRIPAQDDDLVTPRRLAMTIEEARECVRIIRDTHENTITGFESLEVIGGRPYSELLQGFAIYSFHVATKNGICRAEEVIDATIFDAKRWGYFTVKLAVVPKELGVKPEGPKDLDYVKLQVRKPVNFLLPHITYPAIEISLALNHTVEDDQVFPPDMNTTYRNSLVKPEIDISLYDFNRPDRWKREHPFQPDDGYYGPSLENVQTLWSGVRCLAANVLSWHDRFIPPDKLDSKSPLQALRERLSQLGDAKPKALPEQSGS